MTEPGTDAHVLRDAAYASEAQLDVRRRTHRLYTVEPVDFGRWTVERIAWQGVRRVLDVGCGPGEMLLGLAREAHPWELLAGLDLSPGMIAAADHATRGLPVHLLVADAQSLPFAAGFFDVVMARHMLYHVPDIDRAVAEAARLLVPGGRFLATTNSARTMPQYMAIYAAAAERFPAMAAPKAITDRFCLENAPKLLAAHFAQVTVHTLPGVLRFPTALPFVDYFASARDLSMRPGHTEDEWQAVLEFVRAEAEALVARHGHLDVDKVAGAIVAVKAG